ncbi:methyltransferase family protein [Fusobacterium sp. PH5-44]|uniref:methyltransferase family protein n=1 Tax=unclassified Fusobacterium TaxID=2648384 RepID=UPI003D21560D
MFLKKIIEKNIYNNQNLLYMILPIIVTLAVLGVIVAIIIDFSKYNNKNNAIYKKRTLVSTFTMSLFFILYYFLIKLRIGSFFVENNVLNLFLLIFGTTFVIMGSYINIKSRVILNSNWSDHIKIYSDQKLVTTGAFRYIRHPLYASLFLMFYGGSIIYTNWTSFIATTIIFVPMMNYRAAQEEYYLEKKFDNYKEYKKFAGRFLPKTLEGYKGG